MKKRVFSLFVILLFLNLPIVDALPFFVEWLKKPSITGKIDGVMVGPTPPPTTPGIIVCPLGTACAYKYPGAGCTAANGAQSKCDNSCNCPSVTIGGGGTTTGGGGVTTGGNICSGNSYCTGKGFGYPCSVSGATGKCVESAIPNYCYCDTTTGTTTGGGVSTVLCGNSALDQGEECDQGNYNLGNRICETAYYGPGSTCSNCRCKQPITVVNRCGDNIAGAETCGERGLTCASGYRCNTSTCQCERIETPRQVCGNAIKEGSEQCDGIGTYCTTLDGKSGTCTSSCICQKNCGNGIRNSGEQCDGGDLGGNACQSVSSVFTGGTLRCNAVSCQFDTIDCTRPICGNNIREGSEVCDPPNADCTIGDKLGTCSSNCGECKPKCGNNILDVVGTYQEKCDGTYLAGQSCTTQKDSSGNLFTGGTLRCNTNCISFDTSGCIKTTPPITSTPAACGNGRPEAGEQCGEPGLVCSAGQLCNNCQCQGSSIVTVENKCGDSIVGDEACGERELQCSGGKVCNTSTCKCETPIVTTAACGNGRAENGEVCGEPGLSSCPAGTFCSDCKSCVPVELPPPPVCGNNKKDPGEQCDPPDSNCKTESNKDGKCTTSCTCKVTETPPSPVCGNNLAETGEFCGEPGLSNCPAGTYCSNCGCIPVEKPKCPEGSECTNPGDVTTVDGHIVFCNSKCQTTYCYKEGKTTTIKYPGNNIPETKTDNSLCYQCATTADSYKVNNYECSKTPECGDKVLDPDEECEPKQSILTILGNKGVCNENCEFGYCKSISNGVEYKDFGVPAESYPNKQPALCWKCGVPKPTASLTVVRSSSLGINVPVETKCSGLPPKVPPTQPKPPTKPKEQPKPPTVPKEEKKGCCITNDGNMLHDFPEPTGFETLCVKWIEGSCPRITECPGCPEADDQIISKDPNDIPHESPLKNDPKDIEGKDEEDKNKGKCGDGRKDPGEDVDIGQGKRQPRDQGFDVSMLCPSSNPEALKLSQSLIPDQGSDRCKKIGKGGFYDASTCKCIPAPIQGIPTGQKQICTIYKPIEKEIIEQKLETVAKELVSLTEVRPQNIELMQVPPSKQSEVLNEIGVAYSSNGIIMKLNNEKDVKTLVSKITGQAIKKPITGFATIKQTIDNNDGTYTLELDDGSKQLLAYVYSRNNKGDFVREQFVKEIITPDGEAIKRELLVNGQVKETHPSGVVYVFDQLLEGSRITYYENPNYQDPESKKIKTLKVNYEYLNDGRRKETSNLVKGYKLQELSTEKDGQRDWNVIEEEKSGKKLFYKYNKIEIDGVFRDVTFVKDSAGLIQQSLYYDQDQPVSVDCGEEEDEYFCEVTEEKESQYDIEESETGELKYTKKDKSYWYSCKPTLVKKGIFGKSKEKCIITYAQGDKEGEILSYENLGNNKYKIKSNLDDKKVSIIEFKDDGSTKTLMSTTEDGIQYYPEEQRDGTLLLKFSDGTKQLLGKPDENKERSFLASWDKLGVKTAVIGEESGKKQYKRTDKDIVVYYSEEGKDDKNQTIYFTYKTEAKGKDGKWQTITREKTEDGLIKETREDGEIVYFQQTKDEKGTNIEKPIRFVDKDGKDHDLVNKPREIEQKCGKEEKSNCVFVLKGENYQLSEIKNPDKTSQRYVYQDDGTVKVVNYGDKVEGSYQIYFNEPLLDKKGRPVLDENGEPKTISQVIKSYDGKNTFCTAKLKDGSLVQVVKGEKPQVSNYVVLDKESKTKLGDEAFTTRLLTEKGQSLKQTPLANGFIKIEPDNFDFFDSSAYANNFYFDYIMNNCYTKPKAQVEEERLEDSDKQQTSGINIPKPSIEEVLTGKTQKQGVVDLSSSLGKSGFSCASGALNSLSKGEEIKQLELEFKYQIIDPKNDNRVLREVVGDQVIDYVYDESGYKRIIAGSSWVSFDKDNRPTAQLSISEKDILLTTFGKTSGTARCTETKEEKYQSPLDNAIDFSGENYCTENPEECQAAGCPVDEDLVCGADGKTYKNSCLAKVAGVKVDHDGSCDEVSACSKDSDCSSLTTCSNGNSYYSETCKKDEKGIGVCVPNQNALTTCLAAECNSIQASTSCPQGMAAREVFNENGCLAAIQCIDTQGNAISPDLRACPFVKTPTPPTGHQLIPSFDSNNCYSGAKIVKDQEAESVRAREQQTQALNPALAQALTPPGRSDDCDQISISTTGEVYRPYLKQENNCVENPMFLGTSPIITYNTKNVENYKDEDKDGRGDINNDDKEDAVLINKFENGFKVVEIEFGTGDKDPDNDNLWIDIDPYNTGVAFKKPSYSLEEAPQDRDGDDIPDHVEMIITGPLFIEGKGFNFDQSQNNIVTDKERGSFSSLKNILTSFAEVMPWYLIANAPAVIKSNLRLNYASITGRVTDNKITGAFSIDSGAGGTTQDPGQGNVDKKDGPLNNYDYVNQASANTNVKINNHEVLKGYIRGHFNSLLAKASGFNEVVDSCPGINAEELKNEINGFIKQLSDGASKLLEDSKKSVDDTRNFLEDDLKIGWDASNGVDHTKNLVNMLKNGESIYKNAVANFNELKSARGSAEKQLKGVLGDADLSELPSEDQTKIKGILNDLDSFVSQDDLGRKLQDLGEKSNAASNKLEDANRAYQQYLAQGKQDSRRVTSLGIQKYEERIAELTKQNNNAGNNFVQAKDAYKKARQIGIDNLNQQAQGLPDKYKDSVGKLLGDYSGVVNAYDSALANVIQLNNFYQKWFAPINVDNINIQQDGFDPKIANQVGNKIRQGDVSFSSSMENNHNSMINNLVGDQQLNMPTDIEKGGSANIKLGERTISLQGDDALQAIRIGQRVRDGQALNDWDRQFIRDHAFSEVQQDIDRARNIEGKIKRGEELTKDESDFVDKQTARLIGQEDPKLLDEYKKELGKNLADERKKELEKEIKDAEEKTKKVQDWNSEDRIRGVLARLSDLKSGNEINNAITSNLDFANKIIQQIEKMGGDKDAAQNILDQMYESRDKINSEKQEFDKFFDSITGQNDPGTPEEKAKKYPLVKWNQIQEKIKQYQDKSAQTSDPKAKQQLDWAAEQEKQALKELYFQFAHKYLMADALYQKAKIDLIELIDLNMHLLLLKTLSCEITAPPRYGLRQRTTGKNVEGERSQERSVQRSITGKAADGIGVTIGQSPSDTVRIGEISKGLGESSSQPEHSTTARKEESSSDHGTTETGKKKEEPKEEEPTSACEPCVVNDKIVYSLPLFGDGARGSTVPVPDDREPPVNSPEPPAQLATVAPVPKQAEAIGTISGAPSGQQSTETPPAVEPPKVIAVAPEVVAKGPCKGAEDSKMMSVGKELKPVSNKQLPQVPSIASDGLKQGIKDEENCWQEAKDKFSDSAFNKAFTNWKDNERQTSVNQKIKSKGIPVVVSYSEDKPEYTFSTDGSKLEIDESGEFVRLTDSGEKLPTAINAGEIIDMQNNLQNEFIDKFQKDAQTKQKECDDKLLSNTKSLIDAARNAGFKNVDIVENERHQKLVVFETKDGQKGQLTRDGIPLVFKEDKAHAVLSDGTSVPIGEEINGKVYEIEDGKLVSYDVNQDLIDEHKSKEEKLAELKKQLKDAQDNGDQELADKLRDEINELKSRIDCLRLKFFEDAAKENYDDAKKEVDKINQDIDTLRKQFEEAKARGEKYGHIEDRIRDLEKQKEKASKALKESRVNAALNEAQRLMQDEDENGALESLERVMVDLKAALKTDDKEKLLSGIDKDLKEAFVQMHDRIILSQAINSQRDKVSKLKADQLKAQSKIFGKKLGGTVIDQWEDYKLLADEAIALKDKLLQGIDTVLDEESGYTLKDYVSGLLQEGAVSRVNSHLRNAGVRDLVVQINELSQAKSFLENMISQYGEVVSQKSFNSLKKLSDSVSGRFESLTNTNAELVRAKDTFEQIRAKNTAELSSTEKQDLINSAEKIVDLARLGVPVTFEQLNTAEQALKMLTGSRDEDIIKPDANRNLKITGDIENLVVDTNMRNHAIQKLAELQAFYEYQMQRSDVTQLPKDLQDRVTKVKQLIKDNEISVEYNNLQLQVATKNDLSSRLNYLTFLKELEISSKLKDMPSRERMDVYVRNLDEVERSSESASENARSVSGITGGSGSTVSLFGDITRGEKSGSASKRARDAAEYAENQELDDQATRQALINVAEDNKDRSALKLIQAAGRSGYDLGVEAETTARAAGFFTRNAQALGEDIGIFQPITVPDGQTAVGSQQRNIDQWVNSESSLRYLDAVDSQEKRLGRPLTDIERQALKIPTETETRRDVLQTLEGDVGTISDLNKNNRAIAGSSYNAWNPINWFKTGSGFSNSNDAQEYYYNRDKRDVLHGLSDRLKQSASDDVASSAADIKSLTGLRSQVEKQLGDIKQKLSAETDSEKRKNLERTLGTINSALANVNSAIDRSNTALGEQVRTLTRIAERRLDRELDLPPVNTFGEGTSLFFSMSVGDLLDEFRGVNDIAIKEQTELRSLSHALNRVADPGYLGGPRQQDIDVMNKFGINFANNKVDFSQVKSDEFGKKFDSQALKVMQSNDWARLVSVENIATTILPIAAGGKAMRLIDEAAKAVSWGSKAEKANAAVRIAQTAGAIVRNPVTRFAVKTAAFEYTSSAARGAMLTTFGHDSTQEFNWMFDPEKARERLAHGAVVLGTFEASGKVFQGLGNKMLGTAQSPSLIRQAGAKSVGFAGTTATMATVSAVEQARAGQPVNWGTNIVEAAYFTAALGGVEKRLPEITARTSLGRDVLRTRDLKTAEGLRQSAEFNRYEARQDLARELGIDANNIPDLVSRARTVDPKNLGRFLEDNLGRSLAPEQVKSFENKLNDLRNVDQDVKRFSAEETLVREKQRHERIIGEEYLAGENVNTRRLIDAETRLREAEFELLKQRRAENPRDALEIERMLHERTLDLQALRADKEVREHLRQRYGDERITPDRIRELPRDLKDQARKALEVQKAKVSEFERANVNPDGSLRNSALASSLTAERVRIERELDTLETSEVVKRAGEKGKIPTAEEINARRSRLEQELRDLEKQRKEVACGA